MLQTRRCLRFAAKARCDRRIFRVLSMENLDGDRIADVQARGNINCAHAALAQNRLEAVFPAERLSFETISSVIGVADRRAIISHRWRAFWTGQLGAAASAEPRIGWISLTTLWTSHSF